MIRVSNFVNSDWPKTLFQHSFPATEAPLRPSCQDVQSGGAREPPQQVPDDVPDLSRSVWMGSRFNKFGLRLTTNGSTTNGSTTTRSN